MGCGGDGGEGIGAVGARAPDVETVLTCHKKRNA